MFGIPDFSLLKHQQVTSSLSGNCVNRNPSRSFKFFFYYQTLENFCINSQIVSQNYYFGNKVLVIYLAIMTENITDSKVIEITTKFRTEMKIHFLKANVKETYY